MLAREVITAAKEKHRKQEKTVELLIRFWGLGKALDADEKELLLLALDAENKGLRGPIHLAALDRLKEKGIE